MEELAMATDLAAPPNHLAALTAHPDKRVREAVARNPNTPTDALFQLAVRHADAVLSNPVLGLLVLENPNILAEMPGEGRDALLSSRKCPPALLEWAERNGVGLVGVVTNPTAPKDMLGRLVRGKNFLASYLAENHVNWWGELPGDPTWAAKNTMAQDGSDFTVADADDLLIVNFAPSWLLLALGDSAECEVRKAVARRTEASFVTLARLARDPDRAVRRIAISNPNLLKSNWALERLSNLGADEASGVALALPANATPEEFEAVARQAGRDFELLMAQNSKDRMSLERASDTFYAALSHPNFDPKSRSEILRAALGRQKQSWGRFNEIVAMAHSDTPPAKLAAWCDSYLGDWQKRLALAMNPALPEEHLRRFAGDAHRLIRAVARQQLAKRGVR